MSFKLLAIRPLQGCNPKLLKNLKPNLLYKFYNDYHYYISDLEVETEVHEGEVTKIAHRSQVPENLFWLGDRGHPIKVSVSAIVGKNGSGKSALAELLVAAIVKMSLGINEDFIRPETLYDSTEKDYDESLALFNESIERDLNGINVEIYLQHKTYKENPNGRLVKKIRRLKIKNDNIFITDFIEYTSGKVAYIGGDEQNIKDWKTNKEFSENEVTFLEDFFYTMVINYSHYGYNTNESGEWLKGVFHKNDSYQLPIVINPYRNRGNIDINSEKYLATSRFLVNILQEKELRKISGNKEITHISIEVDKSKFSNWDNKLNKDKNNLNSDLEKIEILERLGSVFFENPTYKINNTASVIFPYLRDYILRKLNKITRYKRYEKYSIGKKSIFLKCEDPSQFLLTFPENLQQYFEELNDDTSHITDKLRQALFFLDKFYLNDDEIFLEGENEFLFSIDELNKRIEEAVKKDISEEEHFLFTGFSIRQSLPSIFKVNYFFGNKYSENNFHHMSSGEKQKIYSIHSVIYHLRNLKSVESKKEENLKLIYYKNVNIIFDEIELYSHPDLQKQFLNDFLNALRTIHLRYDSVNIIFITHSPFILSDIPKGNVLFLNDGIPQRFERMNTFGANITDLLADSFFFSNESKMGLLMGDFARETIEKTIKWINELNGEGKTISDENELSFHKNIIQLIDEPVLRMKIAEMLDKALCNSSFQIELARKEVEFLRRKYDL